jgi:hypothetical protein
MRRVRPIRGGAGLPAAFWAAGAAFLLLAAARQAAADRLLLYTGRQLTGTLIERTDRFIRFRCVYPGGIEAIEVFSVDEVELLEEDAPAPPAAASQPASRPESRPTPAPASQPSAHPASQPASRPASLPASLPAPQIPVPRPGDASEPEEEDLEAEEGETDPSARFDRILDRALAKRGDPRKLEAFVRLLTTLVQAADQGQRYRLSETCKDRTAMSLADLLAEGRVAWALRSGRGRRFHLAGATEYEMANLMVLLEEQMAANRRLVAPYTVGSALPPYDQAAALIAATDLLADQLREWMRLKGGLDAAGRAEVFTEIRRLRDVRVKAGRALGKGPPKDTDD